MKIFVGLGNPGPEYTQTRHNAGFMFVDQLAARFNLHLQFNKKFMAEMLKTEIVQNGVSEDIFLFKPMSFMNLSGENLFRFLDYYYSDLLETDEGNHLLVAHDDLDLALGTYKLHKGKGPKNHNGLLSIYDRLGHKNFWHVRLGVDSRSGDRAIPPRDYVLKHMDALELSMLSQSITSLIDTLFV